MKKKGTSSVSCGKASGSGRSRSPLSAAAFRSDSSHKCATDEASQPPMSAQANL
ncbi:hypothetical protein DPMN_166829 [Dreissena polymorpha]|uniref:Uncharacterized protein n=1 Tax=Dreissena polymorpha TaxID=45954 RepID=A0A9D4EYP7_DREPO|nr:hypothetical protein DPMN_166733 [Dreissena polymorpha]KAH3788682.1 hypothetical protein DPMN_166829 [Dreissena polymorpha]